MKNIVLLKQENGKMKTPIRLFSDWHKAGRWSDENIKSNHGDYYFLKANLIEACVYRLWLSLTSIKF